MPIELTTDTFDHEVLEAESLVLVDFWAVWCGPCRQVAPVVERLAEAFEGRVKVGKVNVDEQTALAERYRVMSIPTLYLFKNGQVVDKLVGARPFDELKTALERHL